MIRFLLNKKKINYSTFKIENVKLNVGKCTFFIHLKRGRLEGKSYVYEGNSIVVEENYRHNIFFGRHKYYTEGRPSHVLTTNMSEKMHGLIYDYDNQGSLTTVSYYQNGVKNGEEKIINNGQIITINKYNAGQIIEVLDMKTKK